MPAVKPIFTKDSFAFLKDLKKHNRKVWMDANRERYQRVLAGPFRRLLEETSQSILAIDERFDVRGRKNFSRINRDIRFSKDKTPYRAQMYLKFCVPIDGDRKTGELYLGLSADTVTVGFRIYSGAKHKESVLSVIAGQRLVQNPDWVVASKKRLGKRYESYWYATPKGVWTKQPGWPKEPQDWKRMRGWIVRKKLRTSAVLKAEFPRELCKAFRELYPLLQFTGLADQSRLP
ncbi:MAG: TIGR02453 family protein [Candidatus Acidiferrum sp.]